MPPTLLPLQAAVLLAISMDVTTLGTSQKSNHTVFVILCLAYFKQHNI